MASASSPFTIALSLAAFLAAAPATSQAQTTSKTRHAPKVVVLDFPSLKAFDPNTNATINEFFATDLRREGFAVITSGDVVAALGLEKQKELAGCTESSCIAEIGNALGSDYIARGTLAQLEQTTAITLSLQDSRGSEVNRVAATVPSKTAEALLAKLGELVPQLVQPLHDSGRLSPKVVLLQPQAPPQTPATDLNAQRHQAFESKRGTASTFRTTGYVTAAAGVIVAGVGGVFGLLSNGAYSSATNGSLTKGSDIPGAVSTGRTDAALADVLVAVGVVGVVAGVALVLANGDPGAYSAQVGINPISQSAVATLSFP